MPTHGAHLVFATSPAWGHLRSLIHFATKIVLYQVSAPPTTRAIITLITVGSFGARIKKEIALAFDEESPQSSAALGEYIRVVSMGGEGTDMLALFPVLFSQFPAYYDLLTSEKPVPCKATGILHLGIPRPKTAVVDVLNFPAAQAIRASAYPIPIIGSAPMLASVMFRMSAPQHLGGLGYLPAWVVEEISKGRSAEDAGADAISAWIPNKGDIIRIPGMHPFYDYEACPQEPSPYTKWAMIAGAWDILLESSAIILDSTSAYEPLTVPALCALREGTDKTIYPVGPLVPPPSTSMRKIGEEGLSTGGAKDEVIAFLDDAEKKYGRHSVLYISFGTLFWPPKPEYAWTWLEALLEAGIPFICSLASGRCTIPDELKARIAASGLGVMPPWAPQQTILTHPATGWFMSHCGHNSIMEAMSAGVPVIAWPIEADQPLIAAYISLVLEASIELVQVRTGERGLRPMYRGVKATGTVEAVRKEATDVLRRAWGEEGKVMRGNAQGVKEKLQSAWREGGDARKSIDAFLMRFA